MVNTQANVTVSPQNTHDIHGKFKILLSKYSLATPGIP